MKIAVAADHRGYEAKRRVIPVLMQWGHQVVDFGCEGCTSASDYPDYAIPAAKAVADGQCQVGIFLDGSGIGMSVAANKVPGVRAALAHDEVTYFISDGAVLVTGRRLPERKPMPRLLVTFLVVALAATLAQAEQAPLNPGSSSDQILDALNAVGQNLKDFIASVSTSEADALSGDATTLTGVVNYQAKGPGDGRLRVLFDSKKVNDRVEPNARSEWLLDNGHLIERDYKKKLEVDREVLKPGQKMNLLKLGEGPFPLPIGQPREDVLKLFTVKKIEPAKDDLPGTTHIQLTPLPNTQFARQFKTIDVWVELKTSFPRRIEVYNKRSESTRTTDLTNVRVNSGLADKDFALAPVQGWSIRKESLEE
ncbi:MAG TPA: RpiB/LacA/LacB family sugar-phosphate isomerase [Tepidisphaeraceae bacterium]|nr:RpiB/LacA/LacB family sugar-phosphate isomerase [Tepidisphaeraceae bacterium]